MTRDGARILAELEEHKRCFEFTRGGLADRVAEAFAAGTFEAMEAEVSAAGAWAALSAAYEAWKSRHFPGRKMAELTMHMKDPDQLKGLLGVAVYVMTQTYGLDQRARDEARWFQEGFSGKDAAGRQRYQPPRPFYEFNGLSTRAVDEVLDDRFDSVIPP